jgi:hypothetical protein
MGRTVQSIGQPAKLGRNRDMNRMPKCDRDSLCHSPDANGAILATAD